MFIIKGKYNVVKVMLPDESFIDEETYKQLVMIVNNVPAIKGDPIVIMPDCHKGVGSVIGFTMKINEHVVPNFIGVDIGCGMTSVCIGDNEPVLKDLDDFIRANIPSGFRTHSSRNLDGVPKLMLEDYVNLGMHVGCDKVLDSIGTLGGGNHFIELNVTDDKKFWLTVHSGSRNLGKKVCDFHQAKAKDLCQKMFMNATIPAGCEFLPLRYGGGGYLDDMRTCQQYASDNRENILYRIVSGFLHMSWPKVQKSMVESVHNFISEDWYVRKGAISAHKGSRVIIPLNMRDGIIIGTGKGNKEWNFSAPHGAGRKHSRSQAKSEFTVEEFEEQMKGIYSSCVNEATLDESPMAYKDSNMIINQLRETVDIDFVMKPVYNFKDSTPGRKDKGNKDDD